MFSIIQFKLWQKLGYIQPSFCVGGANFDFNCQGKPNMSIFCPCFWMFWDVYIVFLLFIIVYAKKIIQHLIINLNIIMKTQLGKILREFVQQKFTLVGVCSSPTLNQTIFLLLLLNFILFQNGRFLLFSSLKFSLKSSVKSTISPKSSISDLHYLICVSKLITFSPYSF